MKKQSTANPRTKNYRPEQGRKCRRLERLQRSPPVLQLRHRPHLGGARCSIKPWGQLRRCLNRQLARAAPFTIPWRPAQSKALYGQPVHRWAEKSCAEFSGEFLEAAVDDARWIERSVARFYVRRRRRKII